jgi:hypothetical protein
MACSSFQRCRRGAIHRAVAGGPDLDLELVAVRGREELVAELGRGDETGRRQQ